ncbi:response regulator [Candidatus Sumerlaeota bacterium]|nr:response regulator [Candidatus Sumerlaeota bacterium]
MARQRIMIVDDEDDIRKIIGYSLINNFEITEAVDGLDALEKIERYEPDLIIMDVMMPLMNGLEASQAIRESSRFSDVPIVFLSGLSTKKDMEKGYLSGADLYLPKPFEPSRLAGIVSNVAKKRSTPSHKKYTIEQIHKMEEEASEEKKATAEEISASPPMEEEDSFQKIAAQQPQPRHRPSPYEIDAMKVFPRVMVVDDDREMLDIMQLILQSHFEVVTAMDGIQAIRKLILYQPDLFVLDIMLPKMSGYQLCQSLRRNNTYKNAPIITVSAKTSKKDMDYALRMGSDIFISKPFEAHNFLRIIFDTINKKKMAVKPKNLTIKDITAREEEEKRIFQEEKERKKARKDDSRNK